MSRSAVAFVFEKTGKTRQGTFIGNVEQMAPAPQYVRIWIVSFR